MRHLKTLLTVLGAVTVLVLASNTIALATTGHAFILGRSNSADQITSLTRTTVGPALRLTTKSSTSAPFVVNGLGKVTNLNADRVDGLHASAFARASTAPLARGFISTGGGGTHPSVATGSKGVSAVTWDSVHNRYVVTVTGQSYFFSHYVTLITPTCSNLAAKTDSLSGKLLVQFGAGTACSNGGFAYLIYKIA